MYPPCPLARRQQNYAGDQGYMYQVGMLPDTPSYEYYPPSPLPWASSPSPSDLPSLVAALNRRATIVSATLAHLTSVIKPLETTKLDDLTKTQLQDMEYEGAGLEHAMQEFHDTMEEVGALLGEIRVRKAWSVSGMGSMGSMGSTASIGATTTVRAPRGLRDMGVGTGFRRARSSHKF